MVLGLYLARVYKELRCGQRAQSVCMTQADHTTEYHDSFYHFLPTSAIKNFFCCKDGYDITVTTKYIPSLLYTPPQINWSYTMFYCKNGFTPNSGILERLFILDAMITTSLHINVIKLSFAKGWFFRNIFSLPIYTNVYWRINYDDLNFLFKKSSKFLQSDPNICNYL